MSFFFKPSRPRSTPSDLVREIKDSLLALDTRTVAQALEEVEKNIASMRQMLSGDGEAEPNQDQVSQIAYEICKEDAISLFVHNLPNLGWDARKDLVYCWTILLRQTINGNYCCVDYIENHLELLDFLVVCYHNQQIALSCGSMLRECIKYQSLAKYVLESTSFELFFNYCELPNFDIVSDALATFKDLLTKHETTVSQYLSAHYEQDKRKNIKISAFHIFKVFVANPHKPREIIEVLAENRKELCMLLDNLPIGKGGEDDEQLEEEKDLVIKEIQSISRPRRALS